MKIAVPVGEDQNTIIKRMGHAAFFAIFENGVFVETVKNKHGQSGHHEKPHQHVAREGHGHGHKHAHVVHESDEAHVQSHKNNIAGIADCDLILVQVIGEHMQEALKQMNIQVKKIRQKDGETATEAVTNFLNNNL